MADSDPRLLYVVGTRPNFVKTAPVLEAMHERMPGANHVLVHTGQHYDEEMSRVFFDELGIPPPLYNLGVGAGSATSQTAKILTGVSHVLDAERPDLMVVSGDVNSTLAAAIAAVQQSVPVAHVESGLRSFDRRMPEELNRKLTDQMSEVLLVHSPGAVTNLCREGVDRTRIHFVGNTMIDTLVRLRSLIDARATQHHLCLPSSYILVTLHRPALVDGELLPAVIDALDALAREIEVVFPVHPRTRLALERRGLSSRRCRLIPPVGYIDFLSLELSAEGVLTDSGGVQEETTFLGIPCFTLRDNTERPVTVEHGTNTLLGLHPDRIKSIPELLARPRTPLPTPPGWDGCAGKRTAAILSDYLS